LRRDVERVLDRRLDRSAPNDQLHHHRRPNKRLLNPLQLQRTSQIELAAGKYGGISVSGIVRSGSIDSVPDILSTPDTLSSRRLKTEGQA
jgi:hypothetical protein